MRSIHPVPFFVLAFVLGFNAFGACLKVKSGVEQALAVSTTTITSGPVEQ